MNSGNDLLFWVLWVWLVCQLLIYRHQVCEGDLCGQKTLLLPHGIFSLSSHCSAC